MKKVEKIELVLIVGLIIVQFFTVEKVFSPLIFLLAAISLSLYFSTIKTIKVLKEREDKYYGLTVNLLISIIVILAYVSLKIKDNNSLHFVLLSLLITNWVLIFLWNKRRRTSDLYVLFLNMSFIAGASII